MHSQPVAFHDSAYSRMTSNPGKYIIAAICAVTAIFGLRAESNSPYTFLQIPTSAHAFALGGAGSAIVDDDITLIDSNPALLGPEVEKQAAFSYMLYLATSNFASARFAMAADDYSAWGIGIRYLNYGSMKGYDFDGTPTADFTPQDIVIEGTYSRDITDRLRGGANFKVVYSNYEQFSAWALAVDLGINYYDPDKDLSLSAVLSNMGGQVKRFNASYDRLPFDFSLAYMQGLANGPFSVAVTANNLTRWTLPYYDHDSDSQMLRTKSSFFSNFFRHLIFGIQYAPSEKFYAALGYNYKTATDMSSYSRNFLSGFSLGVGLRIKSFRVDVSYAMPHKHGSSLMLNLATNIDELMR